MKCCDNDKVCDVNDHNNCLLVLNDVNDVIDVNDENDGKEIYNNMLRMICDCEQDCEILLSGERSLS